MAAESQTQPDRSSTRFDLQKFIEWCERQQETSLDSLARFICEGREMDNGNRMWMFRLRESVRDAPEDVVFIRGADTDTLRFNCGDETRQFHAHRRDIRITERTLAVHADNGAEMCRAGTTTTRNRRGPFPL
jgi:hypothetical protein